MKKAIITTAIVLAMCLSAAASSYDDTSKRIGANKNGKAVHYFLGFAASGGSALLTKNMDMPEWVKGALAIAAATATGFVVELFDDRIDVDDIKDYFLGGVPIAVWTWKF